MTYKVTTILFIMLATMLLVVACAPKETPKEKPVAEKETATEQDVSSIETELSDIDSLNEDLNLSELDTLEQDLQELEQLDFE